MNMTKPLSEKEHCHFTPPEEDHTSIVSARMPDDSNRATAIDDKTETTAMAFGYSEEDLLPPK